MIEYVEEERYVEDIYGDEIKVGDVYYIDEYNELIHESNLIKYLLEYHELKRRER